MHFGGTTEVLVVAHPTVVLLVVLPTLFATFIAVVCLVTAYSDIFGGSTDCCDSLVHLYWYIWWYHRQ